MARRWTAYAEIIEKKQTRRNIRRMFDGGHREELFPILRTMGVRIRPPEAVAISPLRLRALKWGKEKLTKQPHVQESLMLREMAHAQGVLTVYLQIPEAEAPRVQALCQAIGYWGQTDSLASCVAVSQSEPPEGECVLPFQECPWATRLHPSFSGLATEFRDQDVSWEEVTIAPSGRGRKNSLPALVLDLYLWPLILLRQSDGQKLFRRQSLREALMMDG